jgi:hypothetical protein
VISNVSTEEGSVVQEFTPETLANIHSWVRNIYVGEHTNESVCYSFTCTLVFTNIEPIQVLPVDVPSSNTGHGINTSQENVMMGGRILTALPRPGTSNPLAEDYSTRKRCATKDSSAIESLARKNLLLGDGNDWFHNGIKPSQAESSSSNKEEEMWRMFNTQPWQAESSSSNKEEEMWKMFDDKAE